MIDSKKNKEITPKAPYRFVPLSEKVVSPYWRDAVSHDIPFYDGQSGTIRVKMTAHAPVFISNGSKSKDNKETLEFSNIDGKYFIPATSISGMIRNLVEIMAFGGMKPTIENRKYAFRDLRNKKDYIDKFKPKNIHCGYLRKDENDNYILKDCGIPGRISQVEIDKKFRTNMAVAFDKGGRGLQKQKEEREKSALYKYEQYESVTKDYHYFETYEDETGKKISEFNKSGSKKGKIIFTGQPGPNKLKSTEKIKGKHYEFVFFENDCKDIVVDEKVIRDFKFAYFDHDKNSQSVDWKHRKKQLGNKKGIPVFFQKRQDGDKKVVSHLGLSYLYKLPYANDIHQTLTHTQKKETLDLSRLMFGYIDKDKVGLKGRVNFGHAQLSNDTQPLEKRSEVLASPRASYYPFYLKQDKGTFQSYMSNAAELAGWKRYPVHKTIKRNPAPNDNENISVSFKPLPEGSEFTFDIYYHNLKKVELGALVSAITFHNTKEAFHNIGMAKPLGYGKVKLEIENSEKFTDYLKDFESFMNSELKTNWTQTDQIKELIALCTENETFDKDLSYMELKDFGNLKKGGTTLSQFRSSKSQTIKSVLSNADLNLFKTEREKDEEKMQNVGEYSAIIKRLQEKEKNVLQEAFNRRKKEIVAAIKEQQKVTKSTELEEKEKKGQNEQERINAEIIKQGFEFFVGKNRLKDFKDLRNLSMRYGRIIKDCKNNELYDNYPEGFITREDDVAFISSWLKKRCVAKKRDVKDFNKPFGNANLCLVLK